MYLDFEQDEKFSYLTYISQEKTYLIECSKLRQDLMILVVIKIVTDIGIYSIFTVHTVSTTFSIILLDNPSNTISMVQLLSQ